MNEFVTESLKKGNDMKQTIWQKIYSCLSVFNNNSVEPEMLNGEERIVEEKGTMTYEEILKGGLLSSGMDELVNTTGDLTILDNMRKRMIVDIEELKEQNPVNPDQAIYHFFALWGVMSFLVLFQEEESFDEYWETQHPDTYEKAFTSRVVEYAEDIKRLFKVLKNYRDKNGTI